MKPQSISEQGFALLKAFEGFSAVPYVCSGGKRTIGYGHVIGAGEKFPDSGISREQAELLLKQDVGIAERAVSRLVTAALNRHQFDALVCFAYNVGETAFKNSTLLRELNRGDFSFASQQFCRWVYAGGKRSEGLMRRRAAEAALFSREEESS